MTTQSILPELCSQFVRDIYSVSAINTMACESHGGPTDYGYDERHCEIMVEIFSKPTIATKGTR